MIFKKEIRVLGIDDSPFKKFVKKDITVIGTVFRGGNWIDGVITTKARVDGNNATENIIEMVNNCKFKPQLRAIMLNGIAVGGFNIIDIRKLNKKTKIPVIVVVRRKPNIENIKRTLIQINKKSKIKLIDKAGQVEHFGNIYAQYKGIDKEKVKEILRITCTRSNIPEPIRVAHLMGAGLVLGESRGRA